ncbi:hypothetical protein evm_011505 [Chilo suppressalis]|nr:hypothetical protein evm_011505 [Chilo suppressalis]
MSIIALQAGRPLPNARALRVALVPDGRIPNKQYSQLLTNFLVAITGDTSTVHDTGNYIGWTVTCCMPGGEQDPRCMPIRVPDDDVHLRRSNVRCLNLTRSITYQRLGCIPDTIPPERVSLATPMLDLSVVYGTEESKMTSTRERWGGRLTTEKLKGKDWPPGNGIGCLQNNLNETRCHNSAELIVNSLVTGNMAFLWFFRQHNYLAEKLGKINPCWDDDKLFAVARDINIAIFQQILYYDLMPNVVDYNFLVKNNVIFSDHEHVDDYDPSLEPLVSLEYTVMARWFHTLQEGRLNLYDNHGKILRTLAVVDMTLHTGALPLNNTLEGLTQGSFRQPCASTDKAIDPDMGERVLGRLQFASDVMSSDIMKARDNGLPSYNKYRELCNLPVAHDFEDFYKWLPKDQAEAFQMIYEDVEDVEVMAGLLAERPMGAGVVGPTHACIIADQMLRWRRADRFWYEHSAHPAALTPDYGSYFLEPCNAVGLKKLDGIQSKALRLIAGAMKSSPINALQVECVDPPLRLRRQYLSDKFLFRALQFAKHPLHSKLSTFSHIVTTSCYWRLKSLPCLVVSFRKFSSLHSPTHISQRLSIFSADYEALTLVPKIYFTLDISRSMYSANVDFNIIIDRDWPDRHYIYSDASKNYSSGLVGVGVYHQQSKIVQKIKLPPETSVFTGECYGLFKALEYIYLMKLHKSVICSDSKSALQALQKFPFKYTNHPVIIDCRKLLWQCHLKGFDVVFAWIPSHIGISGNEIADKLANDAVDCGDIFPYKNFINDLLGLPNSDLRESWEQVWSVSSKNKGKHYSQIQTFIPTKPWFYNFRFSKM